jgi:release factor glutamine methyltransferase
VQEQRTGGGAGATLPPPAARVWTTLDLINWTKGFFERKGVPAPRLEAELLLAEALGCDRVRLYLDFEKPVPDGPLAKFRDWVKRRGEDREPLAYLVGHAQFLELKLRVTPAVLIPRPETEELAVWARGILGKMGTDTILDGQNGVCPHLPETLRALDLGTGSGCLALALAAHEPRVRVTAVDISAEALGVARGNAAALELAERVTFLEGDLFAPLPPGERGTYQLVVANPPYVDPAAAETLMPEVRAHEPRVALYAGEQGLAILRRIAAEAGEWLAPGGRLGLEIGPPVAAAVRGLLAASGSFEQIEIRQDARKCDRLALAVKKAPQPK